MRTLTILVALLGLTACETEAQTSYCEAACEWTTQCEAEARAIDPLIHGDCRAATMAINGKCETQEVDGVDAASAKVLTECTDALAAKTEALDCSGITGSYDEMVLGAPPKECATQESAVEVFTEARYSTWEQNGELCDRFTTSWCERVDQCLVQQLGVNEEVWEALGGTGAELCIASSGISSFANECDADSLYERETDLTSPNLARQGARECLGNLDALTCDQILGGDMPEECAASFTSTEQATSFAGGIFELVGTVEEALEE